MELNREMYEKAKTAVTGTGGLSHAMDAYAQAYFSVPPITGEWTVEAMREELSMLLWDYHNGCIDLRRRSAERCTPLSSVSTWKNCMKSI